MTGKKPIGGSYEPETELRPDSAEHLGLTGSTNNIKPVLAQKMLDLEKEWLKAAHHGPCIAGARREAIRRHFAKDFGNNAIRYHQVPSRSLDSPAAEAAEPVLVRRLCVVRDNQDA